jgi:molybdopterin-guanine dinucleotide biosynthesis protein MobB
VAATRLLSIIGRKHTGKTTLTVALAAELARRGVRVMTMKHGHHPADVDHPGSDSWRHFREGRAERVLLATPGQRILFERVADEYDPAALARRYLGEADVVLVEGFHRAPVPKIEVFRPSVATEPIYPAGAPDASWWAAIVTDDLEFQAACRVVHFQDTMWLQLLATITMERAQVLEP